MCNLVAFDSPLPLAFAFSIPATRRVALQNERFPTHGALKKFISGSNWVINTCTLIIVKVALQIYIPPYYWLGTMQLSDVIYLMSISRCIPHCFLYFVPIGMLV